MGIFAGYEKGYRFDSCFVSLLNVDDLAGESVPFDPALIHPKEHIGPIARFRSTGASVNRKESVVFIEFTGEKHLKFETLQLFQQLRVFLLDFPEGGRLRFRVSFFSCEAYEHLKIFRSLNQRGEG